MEAQRKDALAKRELAAINARRYVDLGEKNFISAGVVEGKLQEQTSADAFRPESYEDEARNQVWELIERKVQGEEIVAPPEAAPQAQIVDLMAALKASLGETEERQPAKKAAEG